MVEGAAARERTRREKQASWPPHALQRLLARAGRLSAATWRPRSREWKRRAAEPSRLCVGVPRLYLQSARRSRSSAPIYVARANARFLLVLRKLRGKE